MATDRSLPGTFNITVVHGDPFARTFTFTRDGAAYALPTEGWRAQIRTSRTASEVVDVITVDASQAEAGLISLEWPLLEPGRHVYDVECVGVRTFLDGRITVREDVSRDDD